MKRNPLVHAPSFAAVFGLVLAGSSAEAQQTKADAGCRAAIQKSAGKLGATANKTIDGCLKAQLKSPSGLNCNDLGQADLKGKMPGTEQKTKDGIEVWSFETFCEKVDAGKL